MPDSFKNILIPVDLLIHTEAAIQKGLELADHGTNIHLLHVFRQGTFAGLTSSGKDEDSVRLHLIEEQLAFWKDKIIAAAGHVKVTIAVITAGQVQNAIIDKAREVRADLIIIVKHSRHAWFPFLNTVSSGRIVLKTGITVLTVRPCAYQNSIKTLVVPIADEAVKNKMDLISTICRKFKVKIHLVTFTDVSNQASDDHTSSLLQVYQWVKSSIHCPVDYAVLNGTNKARAILNYAEGANADFLLLYPESETRTGWLNGQIYDMLPASSGVQVLTIRPAYSKIDTKISL
jgi:nucleotide-binding universal stress UspA family protein